VHYERTVLGYHGCDAAVAERLVKGAPFVPSANDYDWLGHGIYFWEHGLDRAMRFAQTQQARGKVQTPAVVCAVLQLGRCFDLLDTAYTTVLRASYTHWKARMLSAGLPLPRNRGGPPDLKLRKLDCAVLNWCLEELAAAGDRYDTVRGGFTEGEPVYEGAGVAIETHIQIAVRNPDCIVGVFVPKMKVRRSP
jgi:hypothetical protein